MMQAGRIRNSSIKVNQRLTRALTRSFADKRNNMEESRVPTSQFERIYHYGRLATGLGLGMLTESIKRFGTNDQNGSLLFSKDNLERLVRKLSRMRGAALKIGQLISFQDEKVVPKEIQEMLAKLQSRANYMPPRQLNRVMSTSLGADWQKKFAKFDQKPFAAASIGQVHRAQVNSNGEIQDLAVKVQFPGVANSIDSDLNTLALLLIGSRLLPEGLFLENTIANARVELKWETDYIREGNFARKYAEALAQDPYGDKYAVPRVYEELSSPHVLSMEYMHGDHIDRLPSSHDNQDVKNDIATRVMRLCLLEISRFHFMQTDPNWANFLLNTETNKLEILDFGATRDYGMEFITPYLEVLRAAVREDREACEHFSRELGYLTGLESKAMIDAHVDSILILGEPFRSSTYDFREQTVTDRVRGNIRLMLRERLTPPPEETYGLHRKLSGAFLLCARLQAKVPCGDMFREIVG